MKTNFAKSLELVLKHEGLFSDHPLDKGGATMRGITQAVYDAYRREIGKSTQTVRLISDAELQQIYREQYWMDVKGDDLPAGIDYCTFDAAVNSGVSRGAKWLQTALKVSVDGHIGKVTLAAANEADAEIVIRKMLDVRMSFLKNLKTWPTFGKGWTSRVDGVRRDAIKMALTSPPIPDTPAIEPEGPPRPEEPPDITEIATKEDGATGGVLARLWAYLGWR